jgi:hypothetical protein
MGEGLSNPQILLDELIKREHAENQQYQKEDDYFEFFAASQVLKERDLSDEEIDAGICDAALDGGCDSCYLFVDGVLINDDTELARFKRGVNVEFCILQAKNTTSFNESVFDKWKSTCPNLLDMGKNVDIYKDRYNDKVRHYFEMFRNVQIALVQMILK